MSPREKTVLLRRVSRGLSATTARAFARAHADRSRSHVTVTRGTLPKNRFSTEVGAQFRPSCWKHYALCGASAKERLFPNVSHADGGGNEILPARSSAQYLICRSSARPVNLVSVLCFIMVKVQAVFANLRPPLALARLRRNKPGILFRSSGFPARCKRYHWFPEKSDARPHRKTSPAHLCNQMKYDCRAELVLPVAPV